MSQLTHSADGEANAANNTYKAVRIIGKGYDLYYSVWCNNDHELYDVKVRQTPQIS